MTNTSFQSDITELFTVIRKFDEKYKCATTCITIFDKENGLWLVSSFPEKDRIGFFEYVINFLSEKDAEKRSMGIVPKFDN